MLTAIRGLLLIICALPLLQAGSPPMITDDPGTPGDGHWEFNFGVSAEKRPGSQVSELPLIDLNYGIGDRLQLKYEVPYIRFSEDGTSSMSGFGNSAFGLKWRFFDAGENGLSMSVYPQLEFNNPGSSSDDKGLVEKGTVFVLPFQFEREVGGFTFISQIGREFHSDDDTYYYGCSVGHQVGEKVGLTVELAGAADTGLHRSQLIANIGLVLDLSESTAVMLSVGRELHNDEEPDATFIGYFGGQWRL